VKIFSITELLRCDHFIPEKWFRELAEYGKYAHEEIISILKEKYPSGEAEVEISKQFIVDGEIVEIRGRVDYVDYDEAIIYEIKPETKKIPLEWMMQLWFYILAFSEKEMRYYDARLVLYDRRTLGFRIVRPFFINLDYEGYLLSIVKFKLKNDDPIRGGLCRFCVRRRKCTSRYKFDKYNGVIEIKELM